MKKEDHKISCPIFQKQEPVIQDITAEINNTKDVLKKAEFAKKLQEEVDLLLSCPDYKEKDTDCGNCRFIANIRKKTADLIIKAKKLA
ncbi:MAG: hypothetical protein WAV28_14820 [Sedimentisphaerales bacterium]|jgi:hypothetical protein